MSDYTNQNYNQYLLELLGVRLSPSIQDEAGQCDFPAETDGKPFTDLIRLKDIFTFFSISPRYAVLLFLLLL